jgi:ABC-type dipeptide/oligopeptide/nickel transport system permease subunit
MTALARWARGDALAALSGGLLLVLVAASVLVPWLGAHSYSAQRLEETFQGPSVAHWLGTDHLGRDVLARLAYGGRISFLISGTAVLAHTLIGLGTGLLAGGVGGRTDGVLMRLTDVFLAFPPLLFLILLTGLLGPRIPYIILALSLVGWAGMARQLRAEALGLRTREFVVAARALGASRTRILGRHILANVLTLAAVRASLDVGPVILSESTLSFLGIGVQPPIPSWGTMIADGFAHLRTHPRLTLYPSAVLSVAILALTFVGESLAEALDPRTRPPQ